MAGLFSGGSGIARSWTIATGGRWGRSGGLGGKRSGGAVLAVENIREQQASHRLAWTPIDPGHYLIAGPALHSPQFPAGARLSKMTSLDELGAVKSAGGELRL
jgi:hypothetical protein